MSRIMHFGPIGHMRPIKMPQPGAPFTPVGYSESMQYLSGRMGVRRSLGSHFEYDFTFRGERKDVRHLLNCAGGMFGPGPYFFLDPTWMDENVLPAHWAQPSLGADGAPPIYGDVRPALTPMPANDGSWPASGALFTRDTNADPTDVYIPIPPGHTLHFWYAGTANRVRVQRQIGTSASTDHTPTPINPALPLTTQAPLSVVGAGGVDGVRIRLNLASGQTSATIYGMRAVVLPSGVNVSTLEETAFLGGMGHAGCEFDGQPTVTPYMATATRKNVGVTARLVEVDE